MLHNLLVKIASKIIAYKLMCLYIQKNDLVTHNEFLTTNKKNGNILLRIGSSHHWESIILSC